VPIAAILYVTAAALLSGRGVESVEPAKILT
jgi:hypothetical protein